MRALFFLFVFFVSFFSFSQKKYSKILKNIDDKKELYSSIAQDIWSFAEMGYQEKKSSDLLIKILSEEDFINPIYTGLNEAKPIIWSQ